MVKSSITEPRIIKKIKEQENNAPVNTPKATTARKRMSLG